jgi:LysM repeat protein
MFQPASFNGLSRAAPGAVTGRRTTLCEGCRLVVGRVRRLLIISACHTLLFRYFSAPNLLSMDTISRENNSMLPVGGVIVGVLALIVGGYGAIKASSLQKIVASHQEKVDKIDGLESQLGSMSAASDKATKDIGSLSRTTQEAFNTVAADLANIHASIVKIEEAQKKPVASGKAPRGEVVAGPGEYVIKAGDTFAKIGRAHGGFTGGEVAAVNPGVEPSKLKVGQKIKLPAKK